MRHGLILELCQNRTVISMSEKKLIFLHLCAPTLPAIVPVISRHLNWLSWGWFWTAWRKAPPLEGGCWRLRLSDLSPLLSSCSFFWKCSNASPVLCTVPSHQVVWINASPAVISLLMTLTACHTAVSSVGCAGHWGLHGTSGVKMDQCPWLSWAAVCVSDLHRSPTLKMSLLTETWVHKWGRKGILTCPPPPHSLRLSFGLTRQLHYALELGVGGGLMFLSLYFLNIHLKPLFLKRVAEFNTAGGGGVHVWERM